MTCSIDCVESQRAIANGKRVIELMEQVMSLMEERDALRAALEVIAVGDCEEPVRGATETLVSLGIWRPEALALLGQDSTASPGEPK